MFIMSTNIVVFNTKGGTGKTTIADELCFWLRDREPTSFLNLDAQPGCLHETERVPGAQLVVVDTPGRVDSTITKAVRSAGVVVVPIEPSVKSVAVLPSVLAHIPVGVPVVVVLNGFDYRFRAHQDVDKAVRSMVDTVFTVPRSSMVEQAFMAGVSVCSFAPKSPVGIGLYSLCSKVYLLAKENAHVE